MKRVAVIAIFLAVMASLFAFPVFGTTYNPSTYNRYTDAITINNVTYDLAVVQFKALSTGTSMLPSGMETIMFVTFQISNRNDQSAKCQIPMFNIDLSDQRVITDVYTYGGDLVLGINSLGFVIFPTEQFSYDQTNSIIVPPHSTLTLVGGIGLPAQLNQTGDGTLDTGLRNVHLLNKPYSVTLGDYSYGTPVDLSEVIAYIDSLESYVDGIETQLANMINLATYSGSTPTTNSYTRTVYNSSVDNINNITGFNIRLTEIITSINYFNDVDEYSFNDQLIESGYKRYYVSLYVTVINESTILAHTYLNLYDVIPNGYNPIVTFMASDLFSSYFFNNNYLVLRPSHPVSNYRCVYPVGNHMTVIQFYIDVPINTNLTFIKPPLTSLYTSNPTVTNDYYPYDNYMILRDLYNAYSQVNGLDDISDVTDEITNKSENAHIQEQSYFTQNAQAIEQTGLSNYRFNGDQENGIGSVSHDFTLLWNALGGFNSIYIFSLTLSLALMILRHAPGMIRSSRRNKEE